MFDSRLSLARKGAIALGMLAWLHGPAVAQHVEFQAYGQEQGLENLDVRGVAEDEQGFLWVATGAGLYRWDGARFAHVGPEAGVTEEAIARLTSGSTGQLWVTSEPGLFHENGGSFRQLARPDRLPNLGARGTVAELDGGEIAYISGDRLVSVQQRKDARGGMEWVAQDFAQAHDGFPGSLRVNSLAQARDGVWLGCETGLCKWLGGSLTRLGEDRGIPRDSYNTLLAMRSGDLWARGKSHLLHRAPEGGAWEDVTREIGAELLDCQCAFPALVEDGESRLLMNLAGKLGVREVSGWHLIGEAEGLPSPAVTSIFADGKGDVWLGIRGQGLLRWKGYGAWESYTRKEGLPSNSIWALSPDGGGGLIAGTDAGVAYMPAGARRFEVLGGTGQLRGVTYGAARTADGSLWFSSELTLYRKRPGGQGIERRVLPALAPEIRAVGGDLWVGTVKGLYVVRASSPNFQLEPVRGMENRAIRAIIAGDRGELWVSANDGVHRVDAASKTAALALAAAPGLDVHSIAMDRDGTLWGAVDQRGLVRLHLDGDRVTSMDRVERPVLHSRAISQVYVDSRGWVWVSGDAGIDVWHQGRWSELNEKSGLVWNDTNEGSFLEAEDGSIWVGTSKGLSHLLKPEKAFQAHTHSVRILSVTVGGREIPVASQLRIAPGKGLIEIRVGTTEHESEPHVRLMYSSPGYLDGWAALDESVVRMSQATPRHVLLKFQLFDENGAPVSDMAQVAVVVEPPWWRGNSAIAFSLLAAVGLVGLGWHWRTRQMRARQRQLEGLVARRTNELAEKNRVLESMQSELEYRATHDDLTGLHNRSALLATLKREMHRCRREGRALVASILDLDHFKQINDSHGHSAGDKVLVEMSRRLGAALRDYDASGRYGGEEFILLLPGMAQPEAEHRLNQIREEISAAPFLVNGNPMRVTASFGYAVLGTADSASDLLARADMALYRAKAEGRNRVCFGAEAPQAETDGARDGWEGASG